MRPVRLELTAFGPFAGTEVVDFETLGTGGIFLVQGDTGAGKTSVLDALCYALYGCVPGARDRLRDVRSDHADPARLTSVQLDFLAAGESFRIWRQPKQVAAKTRGDGSTSHQSKVVLFRGPRLELVSNRLDEVGQFMQDLLGMTADQFCQVVLLPQGDFARFLRADAKDRQDLLERLFAAERYRAIEGLLAADKGAAALRVGDLATRADRLLHLSAAEAGIDGPPELADPDWVAGLLLRTSAQADQAAAAALDAAAAEATARTSCELVIASAAAQVRLRSALQRRDSLRSVAADRETRGEQLRAGRRAAAVLPLIVRCEASAVVAGQLSLAAESAVAATGRPALRDAAPATLLAAARALRETVAELKALLPAEQELDDACRDRAHLSGALEGQRRERAELEERLQQLRDELLAFDEVVRAGAIAEAGLDAAAAEMQRLDALHAAAVALPEAQDRLLAAREAQVHYDAAVNLAREHQLTLLARRLDGMAAELAQQLVDGQACAVCGALEHPAPAPAGEAVSPADVRTAGVACTRAAAAADRGRREVEALAVEVASLASASGGLDAAAALPLCLGAAARLAELRSAVAARESAAAAGAEGGAAATELAQRLAALDDSMASARARLVGLAQLIEARTEVIAQGRADFGSIAERIAAELEAARFVELAAAAVDEAARAAAAMAIDSEAAVSAALAAGFSGVAAGRAAHLTDPEVDEIEAWCSEHDHAVALVTAALADPALAVELSPAADPDHARRALDDAVSAARLAQSRADDLRRRSLRLTELHAQLVVLDEALLPARAAYDEIAGLADLAAGSNRLRMRLSAFVLAARLEQVAAAASIRLASMTAGRYTLVHSDEVGDARRKAGLGLKVCDSWTGTIRDASSLSGGETFMASLALALALAEVVREEAGGTQIDCLFVDEGFGSLDETTLDEVMDVLDQLRDGGRLVGLVSHVVELRQRIPMQLRVLKGADGSRLALSAEMSVALEAEMPVASAR